MRTAAIDILTSGNQLCSKLYLRNIGLDKNSYKILRLEHCDAKVAEEKYKKVIEKTGGEILVSGSDDFTLFLWKPEKDKKHIG